MNVSPSGDSEQLEASKMDAHEASTYPPFDSGHGFMVGLKIFQYVCDVKPLGTRASTVTIFMLDSIFQTIPTLLLSTFLVISLETRRWPSDDPMDRISPSSNSLYALFSIRLWHSRFMTQYNAFVISILKQKYIWILNVIDFRSICKCMSWYRH